MVTPVRRITYWVMSTVSALVLLLGYHTSTSSRTAAGSETSVSAAAPAGTGSTSGSSSSADSSSSASSSGSTTVTGTAADTRWGPVQVQLTITGGRITDVSVVRYPDSNGHDRQINARALPILVRETLDAQSADIDMVSGATYTSDGYATSLQSALDQAGL